MHIEVVSYAAVQPNTGLAATAVAGDSLIIKNAKSRASILAAWNANSVAGFGQIIAPSLHDTTRNYRYNINASEIDPRLPKGTTIQPQPQETLSITVAGSNVALAAEMGSLLIHYKDLPGVSLQSIDYRTYLDKLETPTTIQATLTGSAVAGGGYTGTELINAETDLLRANRYYAVLGATTSVDVPTLCISGPDFGNVRLGVPGDASDNDFTCDWFSFLSRWFNAPFIPVFNSGNRNSMNFSFLSNQAAVSPLVTWYLGLLDSSYRP